MEKLRADKPIDENRLDKAQEKFDGIRIKYREPEKEKWTFSINK